MIQRLPYLACIFLGAAAASIPAAQGVSFLTTAAGGIIGAALSAAIWGAWHAGRAAERKALNGGAHG